MQSFDEMIKEIFFNYDKDLEMIRKKSNKKQIVIFGAGQLGHKLFRVLNEQRVNVKCFCDNKTCGQKDLQTGLKIVGSEELGSNLDNLLVLIAIFNDHAYRIVYHQLRDLGFRTDQLVNSRGIAEKLSLSYLEQNIEKYKMVYSILEDEFSRSVYLNRVKKAYLDLDISKIVSDAEEMYFDKEIVLHENEVFVDCGGFDGDTSVRFADRTKNKYKEIIIFEPEEYKEKIIRNRMKNYRYDFYKYGVWSKEAILKFDARGDCGSCVSEEGECEIEMRALDDIVFEEAPTYIKMDIEGAEKEALEGCRKIVMQYKPKLAICIYHKPEDLFEVPLMIKEMCPDYKVFVRQYANSRFETVCYAV